MTDLDDARAIHTYLVDLYSRTDTDPRGVAADAAELAEQLRTITPSSPAVEGLVLNCAGAIINCASVLGDPGMAESGITLATSVLDSDAAPPETRLVAQYNISNGISVQVDAESGLERGAEAYSIESRAVHRERLRRMRVLLSNVGYNAESADTRGRALCNLANLLSSSGRWVEAYDQYIAALRADPTNANASGNVALMLQRLISFGLVERLPASRLYNKYIAQTQRHLDRAHELAGPQVAERWRAMPLMEDSQVDSSSPAADDPYHAWLIENRLPLAVAVEGLETGADRWDSAHVNHVRTSIERRDPPRVFAHINVIKADYLVARRLVFDSIELSNDHYLRQPPSDSGEYVDTLDLAYYGQVPSSFVLAQRAALDVLDRIALAVNSHFDIGDNPKRIYFRTFWFTKEGKLRPKLIEAIPPSIQLYALAELSYDLDASGLYPHANALRNAGTHRFVVANYGRETTFDNDVEARVDTIDLEEITMEALRVARAAILYLISLVNEAEHAGEQQQWMPITLPRQE